MDPPTPRTHDVAFWISVGAALLPIVVAVARAAIDGWVPVGDNGYFAVRAGDVLTADHPLLGTWTSASISTDTNFNNPGPLLFDLLALPTKVIGAGIGVAVGAALINALAVLGIGLVARRRGGPLLGTVALAVAALLTWSMGSQLLFDPWQPHSLLLTFLLGLLLVWSVAVGDARMLPWAVFVGSVIVQTHLSYAILLAALAVWGVLGVTWSMARRRRDRPTAWPIVRHSLWRAIAVAGAVAVLCWSQPLIEQVRNGADGNLARLAANATATSEPMGPGLGVRITADVLTLPPFWLRPSFAQTLRVDPVGAEAGATALSWSGPPAALALGTLALLAAVLAGAAWDAHRRDDGTTVGVLGTAAVAVAAAVVTATSLPLSPIGFPAHQFRWLWPIAAFTTFALVVALARRFGGRSGFERRLVVVSAAIAVVFAVANLPSANVEAGPSADEWAIPVVQELSAQLDGLEREGTLLLDMRGVRFAEPWSGWMMAELQRRDIPFVVDDEVMARQLGPRRRIRPGDDATRLVVREGAAALESPPGARRIAFVAPGAVERAELRQLREAVVTHLAGLDRIPLDDRGEAALGRSDLRVLADQVAQVDAEGLVDSGALSFLVEHDLLELDEPWRERVERYAELRRRADYETVAIFLVPLEPAEAP